MSVDRQLLEEVQRAVPDDRRIQFADVATRVRADRTHQVGRTDVQQALQILEERGDVESRNSTYRRRTADPMAQRVR